MLTRTERPQRPVPSSPALGARKGTAGDGAMDGGGLVRQMGRAGGRAQEITHDALWKAMRSGQREEFQSLLARGTHNINRRDDDDVRHHLYYLLL